MAFDASDFLKGVDAAAAAMEAAALEATNEFAEHLLTESKKLCPVSSTTKYLKGANKKRKINPLYTGHSGALRDSGAALPATLTGNQISAEVGYNTDYAAAVHERLDLNHEYPGAVNANAQAKFLSVPMQANKDRFGPYVAERVKERLGG